MLVEVLVERVSFEFSQDKGSCFHVPEENEVEVATAVATKPSLVSPREYAPSPRETRPIPPLGLR